MKKVFSLAKGAIYVDIPPILHRRSWLEVISTKIGSKMPTPGEEGFTLAEVLITLGIIGVVAAMTIPGLIATYQKEATVNKLKKSISVLNQAYRLSFDDVGELSATETKDMDSLQYFNTYWAPYIKVNTYCKAPKECGYNSYTPFIQANNKKSDWYAIEPRLRATFTTPDGYGYIIFLSTWSKGDGSEKRELYQVIVDINGGEKPNKFGKDVFWLSRTQEDGGGIRPYCYEKTDNEVNKNCSSTGEGSCCAEKIRRDGWKILNDYPWKG